MTTFDLWLLVNKYKIPTIFICKKFILQTKYEKHLFVGYGDEDDKFAFVVLPGFRAENVPNFKIIKSNKGEVFISLKEINEECIGNIEESIRNKMDIEYYLDKFTMPTKTIYKKKKPLLIERESDEENEVQRVKSKIIRKETTPVSSEKQIINKIKQSKKVRIRGEPKNKTKKRQILENRNF